MKFLVDMGIGSGVVSYLRSEGHDVIHLRDAGLHRLPDRHVFDKAVNEGRIILTLDLDFSEVAALSKGRSAGVILFRLRNCMTSNVIRGPGTVLSSAEEQVSKGAVIVVEELRYRIRYLPVTGRGR